MLRMPLILNGPGIPANLVLDDPVSTVEIAATMYHQAQVDGSEAMQSESLLPLLHADAPRRTAASSESNLSAARCGLALQLRTVRTRTHKLMVDLGSGVGEMYDLEANQADQNNLFGHDEHRAMREELQGLLLARPGRALDSFPEAVGLA